jgi:predicted nucleic acid-binding protein
MILVDTSVWIDHLRSESSVLSGLLRSSRVVMHPLVLGELACGNLINRTQLLTLWGGLSSMPTVNDEETLFFIEKNTLMGKGIGYIDVQLLASVALDTGTKLWTHDKRLDVLAIQLGYAWNKDHQSRST